MKTVKYPTKAEQKLLDVKIKKAVQRLVKLASKANWDKENLTVECIMHSLISKAKNNEFHYR